MVIEHHPYRSQDSAHRNVAVAGKYHGKGEAKYRKTPKALRFAEIDKKYIREHHDILQVLYDDHRHGDNPLGIMPMLDDEPHLQDQDLAKTGLLPSLLATDMVYSPYQWTIKNRVVVRGVGLHNGKKVTMTLEPAPQGHGIKFYRTDVKGEDPIVPAHYTHVVSAKYSTRIANQAGVCVNTIEHFMAALFAFGVDNLLVRINNDEVPILDGSAKDFLPLLERAELTTKINGQGSYRPYLQVLKAVELKENNMLARLTPADFLDIDCQVNYPHPHIGKGQLQSLVSGDFFFSDIASARTFVVFEEIDFLKKNNMALGGSLDNAVVVGKEGPLNKGGLRYPDEYVRHKFLDIIGDLALSPFRIIGKLQSLGGGHFLNNQILRQLFADESNYRLVYLR